MLILLIIVGILGLTTESSNAATNQFKGVNWADSRDNFQSGVIYVSGLSSSDTYSSAATTADRVVSQFMSLLGSNSVRMPINEATVSNYWGTYTGAIDTALSKGKVILCYWAPSNGKPADMTAYWNMWSTVISKYGSNANCYFEPINEPYGYNATDLCNLYYNWITRFSSVQQGRVILDGSGYAENVSNVGSDSRLNNCLLAVHDYAFWTTHNTESDWQNDLASKVGNYSNRVIMTEWGAPMTSGKNYNSTGTDNELCYIRGISNQLRGTGMGSFYWPGLRDGDTYSMTKKNGTGSSIALTVNNSSGLDRLKYA